MVMWRRLRTSELRPVPAQCGESRKRQPLFFSDRCHLALEVKVEMFFKLQMKSLPGCADFCQPQKIVMRSPEPPIGKNEPNILDLLEEVAYA